MPDDKTVVIIADLMKKIVDEIREWRKCEACGFRFAPGVECPHWHPSQDN